MVSHSHFAKVFFAFMAMLIVPLSGLSIDIYVPSLPAVGQYFHVSKSLVQLSITTYMIGLGMIQLFAGSFSDSFGRKKPFLISMVIFLIATFFIPASNTIYQLLFLRFIQGAALGAMVAPMRSVIPDLFEGDDYHKMMTYMVMAWSIGPIIAPAIGGYLQHYFGWKANFYFLGSYSAVGFLLILFFLPETSTHRHRFHLGDIFQRNLTILSNRMYIRNVIMNGLLYSILILFSTVGPFLIQTVLHYSAIQFGHIALLIGLAWFLGTMTNRFLIAAPQDQKIKFSLSAMLIISLSMVFAAIAHPMNLFIIALPVFLLAWCAGFLFPTYVSQAISLFPTMTGSANSLFGAVAFSIAGLGSALGALLKSGTQLPLALTFVVLVTLCIGMQFVRCRQAAY
ncbi:MAG TPA: multidrug effflux MFS transporter [Gammaproteobacteria bacterium]|nr:multidrug effflux MFS transporter [Gammaproteobacteria bacterium]